MGGSGAIHSGNEVAARGQRLLRAAKRHRVDCWSAEGGVVRVLEGRGEAVASGWGGGVARSRGRLERRSSGRRMCKAGETGVGELRVRVQGSAVDDGGGVVECEGTAAAHGSGGGEVVKVWRSVRVAVGSIVGVRVGAGGRRGGVLNGVEHFMCGNIDAHLAQLFVPELHVTTRVQAGG